MPVIFSVASRTRRTTCGCCPKCGPAAGMEEVATLATMQCCCAGRGVKHVVGQRQDLMNARSTLTARGEFGPELTCLALPRVRAAPIPRATPTYFRWRVKDRRRQGSLVVAGVYNALGNVGEFCLAFLGYEPHHVEGANIVDAVALHDDAFGLTNTVSC